MRIDWTSTCILDEDIAVYATEWQGRMVDLGEGEAETEVGRITAYYLDLAGAEEQGIPLVDVFDQYSDGLDYYQALFDSETGELSDTVLKLFDGDILGTNLLIVDRVEILPPYRGRRLGLAAVYRAIQQLGGGCGLVALEPFPLQFGIRGDEAWARRMELDALNGNRAESLAKLRAYWGQLGFVAIPGTPIMALSRALRTPTLGDLGFEPLDY